MKRYRAVVVALVVGVLLLSVAVAMSEARVHWGVSIGLGPFWWGAYPYGWYPPPNYYGYPPYGYPLSYGYPSAMTVEPPVYMQAPPPPPYYWYYCAPTQAYYPHVPTCTEPWIKVAPRPQ